MTAPEYKTEPPAMTTPTLDTWLRAQQMTETFAGFSAHEIESMSMEQFARLTGRQTPTQAAIQKAGVQPPGTPRQAPEPAQPAPERPGAEPQGLDPDSPEYFHAWRAQRKRGGEGAGIFDSIGSRSEAYTDAVRAQSGRTGWNNANVVESPRIERAFLNPDEQRDTRSAAGRFSTPGNSFQL